MLLMHRPWPDGEESSVVPEGVSPASHFDKLDKTNQLGQRLSTIVQNETALATAQKDQGRPGESYANNNGNDASEIDSSSDCEDAGYGSGKDCPSDSEAPPLPPEAPSSIPNAKDAVILNESEFKNQANHIVHLTQKHTVKLKRTNQLSLEEQDELSSSSAGSKIFPYANASTMQSDLQERVDDMSGKQRKYFDKIKDHVKGIIPSQLRMILSGEGGTGKTLIIHAAVLLARIVYGRTDSVFGSVLVIGPTGCAAYNAGGCTWQSALNKRRESEKNTSRPLAQETANNLQAKLRGVKFVIFDEFSMLSCKVLLDINRRLKAAQPTSEARSQDFGGLHVLFCGDFYQLPPVSGTSFYESNTTSALDKAGLELWQRMDLFGELTQNFRWEDPESSLAKIAPAARKGQNIPPALLDDLNKNVALSIEDAESKAHKNALWIAPTNKDCDTFNKRKTVMLQKSGAFSCTIWAKHTPAKPEFTAEFNQLGTAKRKQLLERVPTNRRELYSGTGIGINCLRLCVGSRVRCSRNLCTMVGLYQGASLPNPSLFFPSLISSLSFFLCSPLLPLSLSLPPFLYQVR